STTSTFTSDPLNATGEAIAPTEEAEVLSEEQQEQISQNEQNRNRRLGMRGDNSIDTNAYYNRFYIEKVKTGELSVEQALQALEQAGQQNSFEYKQLQSEAVQAQQQVQETLTLQRLREIVGS